MDTITPDAIVVGVDTHKDVHVAVALNGLGVRRGDTALRKMVESLGVRYVSLIDVICTDRHCPERSPDGQPLYFDEDHFTHDAAHFVAEKLAQAGAFAN